MSCSIGPVLVSISFIMVLFNSAVNPFVHALLNTETVQSEDQRNDVLLRLLRTEG